MITAVVLSHNDENVIEKTLRSLLWCDEVLVIDDYSTDKTVTKAKNLKARIIRRRLSDDFAAQRNFGLSQANGEWVLFVDSDEVVTEKLRSEIIAAVAEEWPVGYYIKRLDVMFGRLLTHGETGNVKLLRLGKKGSGTWERPVHEVWNIQGPTGEFSEPLLHFPHPNVAQFMSQINTYSTLNARYLYLKGIHEPFWYIAAYPAAKFFLNYVWRLGFLDGTAGAVVAIMMSFHSFLTRSKLRLLWRSSRNNQ